MVKSCKCTKLKLFSYTVVKPPGNLLIFLKYWNDSLSIWAFCGRLTNWYRILIDTTFPLVPMFLCTAMSKWLKDGEVLEAQGSGEAVPVSPRTRGLPAGSPRPGWGHSPLASPREAAAGSQQAQTMGKAKELFLLCDKEGKGFITKRDMQVSI